MITTYKYTTAIVTILIIVVLMSFTQTSAIANDTSTPNQPMETPEQLLKSLGFKEQPQASATYRRVPAKLQALSCSQPDQQSDCKIYIAGFTHTIDKLLAEEPQGKGLCGDTSGLAHAFIHEIQTNPIAREGETHKVLLGLLMRDHSCSKTSRRINNNVTAGFLIDTCRAGDIGFESCSQYQAGFISALLIISENAEKPFLCGDPRIIGGIATMLNDSLQADYKLRSKPAVTVMLDVLSSNMPCPEE